MKITAVVVVEIVNVMQRLEFVLVKHALTIRKNATNVYIITMVLNVTTRVQRGVATIDVMTVGNAIVEMDLLETSVINVK